MKTLTPQERWLVFVIAAFILGGAVVRCRREALRETEPLERTQTTSTPAEGSAAGSTTETSP